MKRSVWFGAVLMLAFLGMSNSGWAISVSLVNLPKMVEAADRAFVGKCMAAKNVELGIGMPVVEYVFEVRRALRGVSEGQRVVFRQLAGRRAARGGLPGFPHHKMGEEMLLFLYPDSRIGLTSPVGMGQGVFAVQIDDQEEIWVSNSLSNSNLDAGLSESDIRDIGLSPTDVNVIRSGGPIPLRSLEAVITRIDRYIQSRGRQR